MLKLGVIINPFAGLGGSVALKGTDGARAREQAIARGARPRAEARMRRALEPLQGAEVELYGFAGQMGEAVAGALKLPFHCLGPRNLSRVAGKTAAGRRPV